MSEKAKRAKHREELLELQSMVEPARNDEIARRAIEIAWRYLEKAENQAKMLEIYAARQLVEGKENDLPSAQPERKKGRWVRNFDGNEWYWFCSNCKEKWYEEDLLMGGNDFPKFCPNCGADMRGEEE